MKLISEEQILNKQIITLNPKVKHLMEPWNSVQRTNYYQKRTYLKFNMRRKKNIEPLKTKIEKRQKHTKTTPS